MSITSATAAGRGILFRLALGLRHCHCSRCRNLLGNLVAQGVVIRQSQIKSEGESNLRTCRGSPGVVDCFCKTWGCRLFSYEDSEKEPMYFAPARLDGGVHPGHPVGMKTHSHVGSKAEWEQIGGGLPQYDGAGPDGIITGVQRAWRRRSAP